MRLALRTHTRTGTLKSKYRKVHSRIRKFMSQMDMAWEKRMAAVRNHYKNLEPPEPPIELHPVKKGSVQARKQAKEKDEEAIIRNGFDPKTSFRRRKEK